MDASFSFIVIQCFIFTFVSEFPAGEHLTCSSWLHAHGKWTSFINGLHLYSFSCLNSLSELFTLHSQTHSYSAFTNILCVLFPTIHTHSHYNDTLGLVSLFRTFCTSFFSSLFYFFTFLSFSLSLSVLAHLLL